MGGGHATFSPSPREQSRAKKFYGAYAKKGAGASSS